MIDDSRDVVINNFIINGDPLGTGDQDVVDCENGSMCRLNNNTMQNSPPGAGVWVGRFSNAEIIGGLLQGNVSDAGIAAAGGGKVHAVGVTTRGNGIGVSARLGGLVEFASSTSTANLGAGIEVREGAMVICASCVVTRNRGNGVDILNSSSILFSRDYVGPAGGPYGGPYSVTGNGGTGVSVWNVSSVSFRFHGSVTGNSDPLYDVVCNSTTATAFQLANGGVTRTNCTGP